MYLVLFLNLFLDLSRHTQPPYVLCIMCWVSLITFVHSQSACGADRQVLSKTLPDNMYSLFTGVHFR